MTTRTKWVKHQVLWNIGLTAWAKIHGPCDDLTPVDFIQCGKSDKLIYQIKYEKPLRVIFVRAVRNRVEAIINPAV